MTNEEYKELQERFDNRYKLRLDCEKEMDEVYTRLAKNDTTLAVINTKLSLILWGLGTVAAAVIGCLVKLIVG